MTEKLCPECNGEGVVDEGTEDERRCPTCNGSGVVPDDGQGSEEVWNTHPERAMTAEPDRLGPLPLDGAPYRDRRRPFRDPALEPPDQLGRLVLIEHAADRRGRHNR
jgi:hypothetical protein